MLTLKTLLLPYTANASLGELPPTVWKNDDGIITPDCRSVRSTPSFIVIYNKYIWFNVLKID